MRTLIITLALAFAAPAAAEEVAFDDVQGCSVKLAEQVARQPEYAVRNLWEHGWETFDDVPADQQERKLGSLTKAMRENLADVASHINFGNEKSLFRYETYGIDEEEFLRDCAGLEPELTRLNPFGRQRTSPDMARIFDGRVIPACAQDLLAFTTSRM